jgi:uncharacterized protein
VLEGAGEPEAQVSEVTPASVLLATRTPLTLTTSDGLRLIGELAVPEHNAPVATLVCLHPLPTAEGMMDSHVLRKASYRLPALADVAVLRFNTRGTCSEAGCSEGTFDEARGEGLDAGAAVAHALGLGLPNVWLLGWSFGTDVALKHGLLDGVEGAVLLSPPLRYTTDEDLLRWAVDGRPLHAFVPELDDFLRPPQARDRFALVPQAEVVEFPGAKHLWVGEKSVRAVLDAVVARVAPQRAPVTWEVP